MITYSSGKYQLAILFQIHGSIFPRASVLGLVGVFFSACIHYATRYSTRNPFEADLDFLDNRIYMALSLVLGFLLVFRTNQSYGRWWESCQLIRVAQKEWHDACAQLLSFAQTSDRTEDEVAVFQEMCVRLFSVLQCCAMSALSVSDAHTFEVIDMNGFDNYSLQCLEDMHEEPVMCMDMTLQWILRYIHVAIKSRVIAAGPPIVTRVFQELSTGTLHFERLRAISETQFPFPYAQMLSLLLIIHLPYTALVVAFKVNHPIWMATITFFSVFTFWSINLIATELENPFGDDINDLPLDDMQKEFNHSLLGLLDPRSAHIPHCTSLKSMQKNSKDQTTRNFGDWSKSETLGRNTARINESPLAVSVFRSGSRHGSTMSNADKEAAELAARLTAAAPAATDATGVNGGQSINQSSGESNVPGASMMQSMGRQINREEVSTKADAERYQSNQSNQSGASVLHIGQIETQLAVSPSAAAPASSIIPSQQVFTASSGWRPLAPLHLQSASTQTPPMPMPLESADMDAPSIPEIVSLVQRVMPEWANLKKDQPLSAMEINDLRKVLQELARMSGGPGMTLRRTLTDLGGLGAELMVLQRYLEAHTEVAAHKHAELLEVRNLSRQSLEQLDIRKIATALHYNQPSRPTYSYQEF